MAWINSTVSAGTQNTSSNSTQNTYGTRSPTISGQFDTAFGNLNNSLGSNGANAIQNQALGFLGNFDNVANTNRAINEQSNGLQNYANQYAGVNSQLLGLNGQPAATAAPVSAGASGSSGQYTAAQFAPQYASLFGSQVTNPALAAYDYGTARGLTELDARTAAGGGFANSRSSEIPYSDLYTQAALGRGQLSAQLNNQGLTNALGFAQGDAGRFASTDQFNVGQANNQNQFNANMAQQGNIFNAGQTNSVNQSNNALRLNALNSISNNLQGQAGLSNQIVQNIVTANGIDTAAAQNLFQSGAITQSQLADILNAAAQYNGSQYTQDTNTTGNQNTSYIRTNIGVGSAG